MSAKFEPIIGRYMQLELSGRAHRVYVEEAGEGTPLLCLHIAGADGRQYRGLMNEERVTRNHRVIAFDMPCYLVELRWIDGLFVERDDTERALKKGMDGGYFSTHLSKLKKILKRELGPAAAPYLISDGGNRPRLYRLDLPPSAIWYGPLETTASLITGLADNWSDHGARP